MSQQFAAVSSDDVINYFYWTGIRLSCAFTQRSCEVHCRDEVGTAGFPVVDDNEDNRYTLQTLLEADGFERIASAAGGNEAISLIEKEKFSLVLLDMMMPDLNGDEVLRLIRKKAETRDIPVVMISVDTDTDKISKCIELGADDYLPKPFNPTIFSALRRNSLRTMEAEYLSRIEKQKVHSETLLRNILPA